MGERAARADVSARESGRESVEKGVEIIVLDDEAAPIGMSAVVGGQFVDDLQPQCGLAAPFLSKDDCCRGFRVAVNLVPRRMVRRVQAMPLENVIGLGVFLPERVLLDAMMGEKLLNLHVRSISCSTAPTVGCKHLANSF